MVLFVAAMLAAAVFALMGRKTFGEAERNRQLQQSLANMVSLMWDVDESLERRLAAGDGDLRPDAAALGRVNALLTQGRELAQQSCSQKAGLFADLDTAVRLFLAQAQSPLSQAVAAESAVAVRQSFKEVRTAAGKLQVPSIDSTGRAELYQNLQLGAIGIALGAGIAVFMLQRARKHHEIVPLSQSITHLRSDKASLEAIILARDDELRAAKRQTKELTGELAHSLRHADLALRGSAATGFAQDKDLRYTWISRDAMAHQVADILGHTDTELLDGDPSGFVEIKRRVVATGHPARTEILLPTAAGTAWFDVQIEPTFDGNHEVAGLIGVAVDLTERREREGRIQLLLREITHRSKNLLAIIQSMARQTAMRTDSRAEFVDVFSRRIQALALLHDLLIQADWAGAATAQIVRSQLAPFDDLVGGRVDVAGPELQLRPEAAQGLGLAVHELITNAMKFGALSVEGGSICVSWHVASEDDLTPWIYFEWKEQGLQDSPPPTHQGFGHVVLEAATARALSGKSSFTYAPAGATWRLEIPGEWIAS
jgi:two-component sensor histidine kinase